MSISELLQDKTTILVLIAIGVVLLLGVLWFRYKFSGSSSVAESFTEKNNPNANGEDMHCDEVTGICQRVPKNEDISEAEMEAAQQKMESELREDEELMESQ